MLLEALGIVLPDNARPDRAFETQVPFETVQAQLVREHKVPGDFYEVILALDLKITTDASVDNRIPALSIFTPDGAIAWQVPSAAVQTASTAVRYTWAWNVTTLSATVTSQVMPVARIALKPGFIVHFDVTAVHAGDVLNDITLTLMRIPSGPERVAPAPIATPVLL